MTSRRKVMVGLLAMAGMAPVTKPAPASAGMSAQTPPPTTMNTQNFEFVSAGNRLSGFVDVPADGNAHAMLAIIQGYGESDVAGRTSYYDLRSRFTQLGITTMIWDKPGCGKSQGIFDIDQPVESSATEVLDAIRHARESRVPGAQKSGLWGISRAGWIAPLAITQDSAIAYWISVSGTDDKENFPYLLESNLRIEGRTEDQIRLLVGEWKRGFAITSQGGTFKDYLAATQNIRRDPFILYLSGGKGDDEVSFLKEQKPFLDGTFRVDRESGLQVYVPHFDDILRRVNIPVLAIFGERDRNVNWRNTKALYSGTIGRNPHASLTVRTFPDGNHNLQQAPTGGLREMLEMKEHRASDGYYEAMENWLRAKVLA
jgi:pimeloyl-ACP methyl ester carboxylesterase